MVLSVQYQRLQGCGGGGGLGGGRGGVEEFGEFGHGCWREMVSKTCVVVLRNAGGGGERNGIARGPDHHKILAQMESRDQQQGFSNGFCIT